ncbi:5-(carboxyamino)imidazole ribonucleotide synthase [Polycladomyces abyssicola]|nr:5-(carboxyamino)imidazole ribonucleotide synthase [Polycladomyces abyssicola]
MELQVKPTTVLLPGSTVGILGGGQLGRMVILEGRKLGYRFITLDPSTDCPGSQVSDHHISAGYHDVLAAEQLGEWSDVVAYEFENIDPEVVKRLEEKVFVPQGSRLLEITQHRVREKETLDACGIPVAAFRVVHDTEQLRDAAAELGYPCVLKTVTGGYDGKGQRILRGEKDVEPAWQALSRPGEPCIVEQFVPFIKELSVVVARNLHGQIATFPVVENIHRHHILHVTLAPAPVYERIAARAEQLARDVAEKLEITGLCAVEMFLLEDGQLLVNELAPRPHNSGHFTYDACATSQFEQFLRAICGLPLGSTRLLTPAVMVNILGEHVEPLIQRIPTLPDNVKVHLYGKKEAKPGRKMGHVTVLGESLAEAWGTVQQLGIWEDEDMDIFENN